MVYNMYLYPYSHWLLLATTCLWATSDPLGYSTTQGRKCNTTHRLLRQLWGIHGTFNIFYFRHCYTIYIRPLKLCGPYLAHGSRDFGFKYNYGGNIFAKSVVKSAWRGVLLLSVAEPSATLFALSKKYSPYPHGFCSPHDKLDGLYIYIRIE